MLLERLKEQLEEEEKSSKVMVTTPSKSQPCRKSPQCLGQ
jgi:hypothetical protein